MGAIRCVVFDVDDTLYLERDYVRSGFAAVAPYVAQRYGIADFADQAWRLFEAGVRATTFNDVLAGGGCVATAAEIADLVARYRQHAPQICLLADAEAAIAALHGNAKLAVITDGPLDSQQAKVRALQLARWCDPVICTATLGPNRGKPHPEAFERVEQATDCHGGECLYVADNPAKDFQGPKLLGWATIRVRRPLGLHFDRPTPPGVDIELPDLTNLVERIGGWVNRA
jgi:putative hydrolase of the HAD superfamily